jgi:hypothetical protein
MAFLEIAKKLNHVLHGFAREARDILDRMLSIRK